MASNFHNDPKFRAIEYMCVGCSFKKQTDTQTSGSVSRNLDSESHILNCHAYADLRMNMNMEEQKDILTFYQAVIDRRIAEEDNIVA